MLSALLGFSLPVRAGELSFAEAVQRAAASPERLALIEAPVASADARARTALGGVIPTIVASFEHRLAPDVANRPATSGQVSSTIDLIRPREISAWRAESIRADGIRENAVGAIADLRRSAAMAYVSALRSRSDLEAAQHALDLRRASLEQVETLFEHGFAVRPDVMRARVSLHDAEALLLVAQTDLEDALAYLSFLTDLPALHAGDLSERSVPASMNAVRRDNATLRAIALSEDAARVGLRSERLGFLPTVNLSLGYRFSPASLWDPAGTSFFASLNAQWVLFDFSRYGRLDASQHELASLQAERTLVERERELATSNARRRLETMRQRVDIAGASLEAAEEVRELEALRLQEGDTTALELVTADVDVHRAQVALNQIELELRIAMIELAYIAGELEDEWPR